MTDDQGNQEHLRRIWKQNEIPVVLRRGGKGERIRIKIPFSDDNRQWLQNGRRLSPDWISTEKYWEVPKAWFNDFVVRAIKKYGALYIIQPYREQEKCARSCMDAVGHECNCSCMGANHGSGFHGSWFEVSETFATRWNGRHLASRLMKAK